VVEHYDALLGLLAPRFRSVCVELPGFGFSTPKRGFGFSLGEYAATVADLLAALGRGQCVLAFPCVWAYAALKVAAERPGLVGRLVLVQAPSWPEEVGWSRRIDRRGLIRTPFVGQALMALRPRQVAERWYRAALPRGAPGSEGFAGPARQAFEHGACFCLGSLTQAWFGGRAPALPAPGQPALALWGASDRSHGATDKRSILEHAPHAAYLEYADAGHFPELERAERFAETLGGFAAGA
jgi:pimeloyl-ACP methyl ester carboxylesterase